MPPILIDTNILIYASDPGNPARQDQALNLLKHLEITRSGRLSVQCLAEFIHVSTRSLQAIYTQAEALEQVERLAQAFPIFDITLLVVLEAARGARDYRLAYYDAQIWASARLNQISLIFSEDFSDGQILEGVRFVNPFTAGFVLENWT
jgi:predicted nucleic acid-binding protein